MISFTRLPLYYRYGSYYNRSVELNGHDVADNRHDVASAVPGGVKDELARFTVPVTVEPKVRAFLLEYPAYKAIQQQGKGGVFLAMNLRSECFQEVVLKVGYHRGQVQVDGSDGCAWIRRELAFYREIARRELNHCAPRLIDSLETPRKVILVLEYTPGSTLLARQLKGELSIDELMQCWELIDRFHASGLYLGDAKLANFLTTEDRAIRAIDFEAAGTMNEQRTTMCTFYLTNPSVIDPQLADQIHFLVSVLYPYEQARQGLEDRSIDLRSWLKREPDSETSAWALEKLRYLLGHASNDAVH